MRLSLNRASMSSYLDSTFKAPLAPRRCQDLSIIGWETLRHSGEVGRMRRRLSLQVARPLYSPRTAITGTWSLAARTSYPRCRRTGAPVSRTLELSSTRMRYNSDVCNSDANNPSWGGKKASSWRLMAERNRI